MNEASSSMSHVDAQQRFTREHPCPVCTGYESMPHGKGQRCAGFRSADGLYAHCTREEFAASIRPTKADPPTFAHRLNDSCACGVIHGAHRFASAAPPIRATKPNASPREKANSNLGEIVDRYPYYDANNILVYEVLRYEPKSFRPRRSDGKGGYLYNLNGIDRVLYRLPDLLAQPDATIFVVEGEKDVDALRQRGLVATTNQGGAALPWRKTPGVVDVLRGRTVVVIPDNDPDEDDRGNEHRKGQKHAEALCQLIKGTAASVKYVELPQLYGKDVSDFFTNGGTVAQLIELTEAAPRYGEAPLRYRLLTDADIEHMPPMAWLIPGLLPQVATSVMFGESGAGKSFLLLDLALHLVTGTTWHGRQLHRRPVVYLAGEGVYGLRKRIKAWKAYHQYSSLPGFFLLGETPNLLDAQALLDLQKAIAALPEPPALIIIDTLARSMVGGDENSGQDMGRLITACNALQNTFGCHVMLAHHKSKDGRAERGHSALRAAADTMLDVRKDGDLITVDCGKQKDEEEFSTIYLELRQVYLDDTLTERSCILLPRSQANAGRLSGSTLKALEVLRATFPQYGATATQWMKACDMPEPTFYRVIRTLMDDGYVLNNANKYIASTKGRLYSHYSHDSYHSQNESSP